MQAFQIINLNILENICLSKLGGSKNCLVIFLRICLMPRKESPVIEIPIICI